MSERSTGAATKFNKQESYEAMKRPCTGESNNESMNTEPPLIWAYPGAASPAAGKQPAWARRFATGVFRNGCVSQPPAAIPRSRT